MTDVRCTRSERVYPKLRAFLRWPDGAPLDRALPSPTDAQAHSVHVPIRVRPSAPKHPATHAEAPVVLGDAARAALLFQPEPGRTTFDIALDETLLGQVRCRISLGPDGIDATFVVSHATERWLLTAEAPKLRAQLEGKGLVVRSVVVVDAADEDAPTLFT